MKTISTHAHAAKLIRQELKETFPLVKFSVSSHSYSGGNSIAVEWINGPIYDDVMKLVNKYQYGEFNGMEDTYEYTNSRDDIPQVKYVQVRREVSEEIKQQVFQELKRSYVGWENLGSIDEFSDELKKHWGVWIARDYIYRITQKLDLTNGYRAA